MRRSAKTAETPLVSGELSPKTSAQGKSSLPLDLVQSPSPPQSPDVEGPLASSDSKEKIRVNLDFNRQAFERLDRIASETGTTRAQVIRKSLGLFERALKGTREGYRLVLIDEECNPIIELVGIDD